MNAVIPNALTMGEVAARTLAEEMRRDERIWVLGEDVQLGGIFAQYKGLLQEFGPKRVVNTPIAESTIMGAGLGAALVGTRPVIEMRIADFVMPAIDELVNQIAKVRYMFGGQGRASVVVRVPHGLHPGSAAQHSQVIESWFVNVPGLVVVAPSNALDLAGLLRSAVRSDDPVVFFEPKSFFKQSVAMPDEWPAIPFGLGRKITSGNDLTIVSWAQAVPAAERATAILEQQGVGVDLIDLRSLWPWDKAAVLTSVNRTRRLLVVQEGPGAAGFGAEVSAAIAETASGLKGVSRVTSPRIPVPFAPELEAACFITPERIAEAAGLLLAR
jgi:acetoin:2,6-dichlorophenolindophenol oxidoreductase subunit beta